MIKVKEKQKFDGSIEKTYTLIQGDSFRFTATEKDAPEQNLIGEVKFKVAKRIDENTLCQIFEKAYEKVEDKWLLFVESSDTENFEVGDYVSEIEIVYADGGVDTIEQATFKVTPQSKECTNGK